MRRQILSSLSFVFVVGLFALVVYLCGDYGNREDANTAFQCAIIKDKKWSGELPGELTEYTQSIKPGDPGYEAARQHQRERGVMIRTDRLGDQELAGSANPD